MTELLTSHKLAKLTKIPAKTWNKMAELGRIPALLIPEKDGSDSWRFSESDIRKAMESNMKFESPLKGYRPGRLCNAR